jgi:hypothetical protein
MKKELRVGVRPSRLQRLWRPNCYLSGADYLRINQIRAPSDI